MKMYSVAYLEHHADVFAAHLLHKHGLTLDQYLANPEIYARLLHADFPLLPAQTAYNSACFVPSFCKPRQKNWPCS